MNRNVMAFAVSAGILSSSLFALVPGVSAQTAQNDKTISAGLEHSIAIQNGRVWTWGRTTDGQLGYPTVGENYYTHIPATMPQLRNITDVEAGDSHNLALQQDGTLWTWGSNYKGELGDGTDTERPIPQKIMTHVVDISAGYWHSAAVKEDGTVWTWGYNSNSQLGDGTQDDRFRPVQVQGITDIIAVDTGFDHTLALKRDGTVWAWGNNHAGQLGDGTQKIRSTPVRVKNLDHVVSIAAGSYHSVALQQDGTVWTWGYNNSGELGDGTRSDRSLPVKVAKLGNISAITAGGSNTVTLKQDGTVWAFGSWGSSLGGVTPFQITGLTDVEDIATNERHALAKKRDGTIWAWGMSSYGVLGVPFEEGKFEKKPIQVSLDGNVSPFNDLDSNHWAYDNLIWALEEGIVSGYDDQTVRPDNHVTEAEFLSLLQKTFPSGIELRTFGSGHWYDKNYEFAQKLRLPVHIDNANEKLTRGHLAQILVNGIGHEYNVKDSVQYLLDQGLSRGKTSSTYEGYEPEGFLNRAEAVTFLRNVKEQGIHSLVPAGQAPSSEEESFVVGKLVVILNQELIDERPYLKSEIQEHLQLLDYNVSTTLNITSEDFEATDNGHIPYDAKISLLYLNNELIYDLKHSFIPYYDGALPEASVLLPLGDEPRREVPILVKEGYNGGAQLVSSNVFRYWNDPLADLGLLYLDLRQQVYESFYNDVLSGKMHSDRTMELLVAAVQAYYSFYKDTHSENEIRAMLQ
jgi:alpha-tubulin suppressor-like RCC1 family protein